MATPESALGRQVVVQLQDVLARTDTRLCGVITDVLVRADLETDISVAAMARRLGTTVRMVESRVKAAGFKSAKCVVIAAQFVRVWPFLCDEKTAHHGYAERYGYSSSSHLQRHATQLVKCLPKHIKLGVISLDEAAQRIAAYLRRAESAGDPSKPVRPDYILDCD